MALTGVGSLVCASAALTTKAVSINIARSIRDLVGIVESLAVFLPELKMSNAWQHL